MNIFKFSSSIGETEIVTSLIGIELSSMLIDDYTNPVKNKGITINYILEDNSLASSIEYLGFNNNIGFIKGDEITITEKTIIDEKNI